MVWWVWKVYERSMLPCWLKIIGQGVDIVTALGNPVIKNKCVWRKAVCLKSLSISDSSISFDEIRLVRHMIIYSDTMTVANNDTICRMRWDEIDAVQVRALNSHYRLVPELSILIYKYPLHPPLKCVVNRWPLIPSGIKDLAQSIVIWWHNRTMESYFCWVVSVTFQL